MSNTQYRVLNQSKGTLVAEHVQLADSYCHRFLGLMGKPGLPENHGLWLVPCADIHSFFMRFEFDAVFVNREGKVLYTLERMKPWRVSKFVKGGRAVLELNPGTVELAQIEIGDTILLENKKAS